MASRRGDGSCLAIVPFAGEGAAAELQALADERMRQERSVIFPASSAVGEVRLRQLPGKALGAYAWTAGVELACYVERRFAGRLAHLRVLELGSGTGLTAMALARLGAKVTATDFLPELVELAEANADGAGLKPDVCSFLTFAWGEPLPRQLLEPFDLILGSEITYNEAGFAPLVKTLQDLCGAERSPPPTILLAETLRNVQQPRFWGLAGTHFVAKEVAAVPQHDAWNVRDARAPVRLLELQPRTADTATTLVAPTQVVCPKVQSVEDARRALREQGACVLTDCGLSCEDAAALPAGLFEDQLLAVAEPAEVSNRVLSGRGILKEESFRAHTDGHAYGDLFPDFFLLLCSHACKNGGENFLLDGYAVLDGLAADPATASVPSTLELRAVDQTSRLPSVTPVVLRAPCGRRALRCRLPGPPAAFAAQRVSPDSDDPEADEVMLAAYHGAVERAATVAPRLSLRAGEALIVDNYRMFHGRDPFQDEDRLLWRVWIWTKGARGVPVGQLQSTPGDIAGTVTQDRLNAS